MASLIQNLSLNEETDELVPDAERGGNEPREQSDDEEEPRIIDMLNRNPYPPHAFKTKCENCNHNGLTETELINGVTTWMMCLTMCLLFGPLCLFGFQYIPFCVKKCKDVQHRCKNC